MSLANAGRFEVEEREIEYLRHETGPLKAQLYRPRGDGPFPLLIEVHGGAWSMGNRLNDAALNHALAERGIVVAAIDYRRPPAAMHPAAFADTNYAIRWFKAHAEEFGSAPDRVGGAGTSSGAQQALVCAMQPDKPDYAAIPLAGGQDARLGCVVLCWPVIDPISRYRYLKTRDAAEKLTQKLADTLITAHDRYFGQEAAMEQTTPALLLRRDPDVVLPPVLFVQALGDPAHPQGDMDRFVPAWEAAGGSVETDFFTAEGGPGDNAAGNTQGRAYRATLDRLVGDDRPRIFDAIAAFVHDRLA